MTITTLDPTTALVVVDLQQGIVALPLAHPAANVVERSVALVEAFRARRLPVVLVTVDGRPVGRTDEGAPASTSFPDGFADPIPELAPRSGDLSITKRTKGAFTNTGLEKLLRERGVTQLVVCGIATAVGVESTARDAHERGFHVTVATDAVTDRDPAAHEHSLTHALPRVAETGTTDEVLAVLGAG